MTTPVPSTGTSPTTRRRVILLASAVWTAYRQRVILLAFAAWTAYVWASRIVNALGSDTESTGEKAFSVVLSLVLLALTAGVVTVVIRSWKAPLTAGGAKVLAAAAGVTIVVWLIRVPQILMTDRTMGFKVVHALLGAVSIGLAALVWRIGRPALRTEGDGRR